MKLVIQVEFDDDNVCTYEAAAEAVNRSLVAAQESWPVPKIGQQDDIYDCDSGYVGKWQVTGDRIDDFSKQLA